MEDQTIPVTNIARIRWWLFQHVFQPLAWRVCPEPYRSVLRVWGDMSREDRDHAVRNSSVADQFTS